MEAGFQTPAYIVILPFSITARIFIQCHNVRATELHRLVDASQGLYSRLLLEAGPLRAGW